MNFYIIILIVVSLLIANVWSITPSAENLKKPHSNKINKKYVKYKNLPSEKKNIIKKQYQIIPRPQQSAKKRYTNADWIEEWSSDKYVLDYQSDIKNSAPLIQNSNSYNSYLCNCSAKSLDTCAKSSNPIHPQNNMLKIIC